jgi:hypothetical protein
MKRLLVLTLILLTVTLAGVLHGSSIHQERMKSIAINQVYMNQYPEIISDVITDPLLIPVPY